jgi:hypothetical protein
VIVTPAEEAERLCALFKDREVELVVFLSGQLGVLKSQANTLMGLAGLTITVTGFSGHLMVRAGPLSWIPMVAGIAAVLVAIAVTLRTLMHLRWVSQDLSPDLHQTALATIERRDDEQRALRVAGVFLGLGLAGYLLAVVAAAFVNG